MPKSFYFLLCNASGKKYYFYRCTSRNKDTKVRCIAKDLKAENLEAFIQKLIVSLVDSDDYFEATFNQIIHNSALSLRSLISDRDNLNENLSLLKKEITNIVNVISQGTTEKLPKALLDKLTELEIQEENINQQLAGIQ
ncbi:MAG: hypothetical protein ACM34N_05965 [Ignavibacteria bacterium]